MSKCVEVVAGSDAAGEWLGCVVIIAAGDEGVPDAGG